MVISAFHISNWVLAIGYRQANWGSKGKVNSPITVGRNN